MKKLIVSLISILMVGTCVYGQTKEEKKLKKKERIEQEYLATKDLVASGNYTFVAVQVIPLGGQRRFLNDVPNFVRINGEQADISLPYFGVLQAGTGFSGEAGIKFTGTLENYEIEFDDKKQKVKVYFEIQRKNERQEFNFDFYHGNVAFVYVTGGNRNPISYEGEVLELDMELTN